MSFSPQQLLQQLTAFPLPSRFWVAYSGGMDSQVLLHALHSLRHQLPPIHAIHVHHGLHPDANAWVQHCQTTCNTLQIPLQVAYIHLNNTLGNSLEEVARQARYAAIQRHLVSDDVVLTAHHADDQAETLLLNLLRGAGTAGLSAIPIRRQWEHVWLLRPLLPWSRVALAAYAQQHDLTWVDDPSNADTRFDRNFIRHQVIPLLQQRWPGAVTTLNRATQHQADADLLLAEQAQADMTACVTINQTYKLHLSHFAVLSRPRQRNLLRYWLKKLNFIPPSQIKLEQIIDEVMGANADRNPVVSWHGTEVRRYQNQLYAMSTLPAIDKQMVLTWDGVSPLHLPLGYLTCTQQQGVGIRQIANQTWTIRFRQGGEHIVIHQQHKSVKKCLQTQQIPPWLRPFIPLLYVDNTLVAIPGVAVCDAWRVTTSEIGIMLQWNWFR